MKEDLIWKEYLSDDERYADIINGICCRGRQTVTKENLQECDTQVRITERPRENRRGKGRKQTKNRKQKERDLLRKAALGTNYLIAGIEEQSSSDYTLPLRIMLYDGGEYEKQASKIRKKIRKNPKGLQAGEYLYGFAKTSRLNPAVTIVLYSGKSWDGPCSLHEMINFEEIPEEIKKMVPDYKINLVEIRKLEDTSVFRTDVRQVFDFIRLSEQKEKLKELIKKEPGYVMMEEDAYDVIAKCTNVSHLLLVKEKYREGGKINMCNAIKEMVEDGRREGIEEGKRKGIEEGKRKGIEEGKRKGIEEGKRKGIEEGKREGIKEAVIELLREKGGVSESLKQRIKAEENTEILYQWLKTAASASNVEQAEKRILGL